VSGVLGIEKARSIFNATKRYKYADIPLLDITDRSSVISVAAGIRPVGVLEADGGQLAHIKDVLVNHGLFTWSGKTADGKTALWFAGRQETRQILRGKAQTEAEVGRTLSYPECCVKGNDDRNDALKEITSEGEFVKVMENVPRSGGKFPYVSHVACSQCLDSPESLSVQMNAENEAIVRAVDPEFGRLVSDIAEEAIAIEDKARRDVAIQKISAMHRTFFTRDAKA
jgi:hypothetical protein